jgi:hypothetical protein
MGNMPWVLPSFIGLSAPADAQVSTQRSPCEWWTKCYWGRSSVTNFPIIRYPNKHVSDTGCFQPQVKGLQAHTPLGPLERANLNYWSISLTSY